MRRAAKVDANHAAIVDRLRAMGCLVQSLAAIGGGVPDLLVCLPDGRLRLVEVKDGAKSASRRALTPAQASWHAQWSRAPVTVVTGVFDCASILL